MKINSILERKILKKYFLRGWNDSIQFFFNMGYLDKYNIDVRKLNMDENIAFEKIVLPIKYGDIINNDGATYT